MITTIDDMQFGFMPGKSTTDAIFIVRQVQEKVLEGNGKLYCCFVDLEKAYDRVPRELIWWCMRKRGVPEKLVRIVKEMYEGARTAVRVSGGVSEEFYVTVGLHQGSALSPYIFVLVMDVVSEAVKDGLVWELLFADDLVIMATSVEELQRKVVAWQRSLESHGLKMSGKKTEVLASCKEGGEVVNIIDKNDKVLKQVDHFKYLGSGIGERGGCEDAVRERIAAAWLKWRGLTEVLCDRRIPLRLKAKIYKTVIRPVLLYGTETMAMRRSEVKKLEVTEMRMWRWLTGTSIRERRTNEEIRKKVGVAAISEKCREGRLRWLGHVERSSQEGGIARVRKLAVGKRKRGRPRLRWEDRVREDMEEVGVGIEVAQDRQEWRRKTKTADPSQGGTGCR